MFICDGAVLRDTVINTFVDNFVVTDYGDNVCFGFDDVYGLING